MIPPQSLIFFLCFLPGALLWSQEATEHEAHTHRVNSLGFYQGASLVNAAVEDEDAVNINREPLIINVLGVVYQRHISPRWEIGLVGELELARYAIDDEGSVLKRDNAIIFAVTAGFNPIRNLEIFAGPGIELERHKNLFVFKVGVEYGLLIANDWYLVPEISYDLKQVYDNVNIGFQLVKHFGKPVREE